MASNDYHFITHWRMKSTCEEITEILGNGPDLVRWWPSVYLRVDVLKPGAADGLGREVDLYTKGWLPYTLRWQFRVTEIRSPHGLTLEASGDFVGRGIWTFQQDGDDVNITYDWKVPLGDADGGDQSATRIGSPSRPHTSRTGCGSAPTCTAILGAEFTAIWSKRLTLPCRTQAENRCKLVMVIVDGRDNHDHGHPAFAQISYCCCFGFPVSGRAFVGVLDCTSSLNCCVQ